MKYMSLNLMLYMVSLFSNMCKNELVYLHLQLEPEWSPFDIMLNAAGCMAEQIWGIELSNSFDHQCQMSLISYCNKGMYSLFYNQIIFSIW